LFVCPLTKAALSPSQPDDAQRANAAWIQLSSKYGLGELVAVLLSADGSVAYPVWRDIFGLLAEFAMHSASTVLQGGSRGQRNEKTSVATFYDEFGWVQQSDGRFNDALAFEDLREVTAAYRARCHRRVNRHLEGGKYLLDVASGPVQIPEYVSFSERYEKRICVDMSLRGLRQAKQRLGDHAICVAGDITRLPFRDGVIDSVVSLHTIYHVPADEQGRAIDELYRVVKPGGRVVVVSSWGNASWLQRSWVWLDNVLPRQNPLPRQRPALPTDLDLYFSPQTLDWYRKNVARKYPSRLRVWRSVESQFMERFVRSKLSAAFVLFPLYVFEELLPAIAGRIGVCPMFVIDKPEN
jgi:ubiquinone/menaquinone biosynthesis C-methylase UbiE